MKQFSYLSALLVALLLPGQSVADVPSSFNAAKRIAEEQIYYDQDTSFYCGCQFDFEAGPNLDACGYEIRKQPRRASRIEWEHVMPAYDFGRQRQCWIDDGRENCRRTDEAFRRAEADLHNLALRRWVWNSPPELGQNMTSTAAGGMTWTAPRF